ncbi:hypothetical protein BPOR_1575g00010 [Botrytis porri]|uniref:Uncharacterized protein n=2 Tax=Botrytis porri TaxID=87229 RepID=A0A4Z1K4R4_9HELO|nr:hypothetical protein BPOR_1575g00010 [Botrytis porri]
MEEVLDALENMAMDTKSREPSPRQTCDVLSKIYQLKRRTPGLTAVLILLADKKAQQKYVWGTIAVGGISTLVVGGILFCVAPVAATAAALAGSAMGSTSVGVAGGTAAVAETDTLTATQAALSSGAAFTTMAGGAAIGAGSSITFIKFLEKAESQNNIDEDQVTEIVKNLYGRRPTQIAKKHYRATFLHVLVRELANDCRKVIVRLRKLGYARLEDMEWTSKPLITFEESTMSF